MDRDSRRKIFGVLVLIFLEMLLISEKGHGVEYSVWQMADSILRNM